METSHLGSLPQFTSPLGYRVVQVAEERVPPRPKPIRPIITRKPVRGSSSDWRVPILAVGIFTIVIGFVVVLAASSISVTTSVTPPVMVEKPADFFFEPVPWEPPLRTAHIPAALAAGPTSAEDKLEPAESVEAAPGPDNTGREAFGTTVAFVRNPVVACQLAKTEGKLVFHLHVSGNFEDEAFT